MRSDKKRDVQWDVQRDVQRNGQKLSPNQTLPALIHPCRQCQCEPDPAHTRNWDCLDLASFSRLNKDTRAEIPDLGISRVYAS